MADISNYKIVKLDAGNVGLLVPLFEEVFKLSFTAEELHNKYNTMYTGLYTQGHLAFDGDKIAAFHGVIPSLVEYDGKIELCAQCGEAMAAPDHAGKGLFTYLGQLTYDVIQQNDVRFVWGLPNQNLEYSLTQKLGWKGEEHMQCYIIELGKFSREAVFRKTKVFDSRYKTFIKKRLAPLLTDDVLQNSAISEGYGGVVRDEIYYKHKRVNSNVVIKLNDIKVWIKPIGGLLIGDIEVKDEQQVLSTIEDLKKLAKTLGLARITIQTSPNTVLDAILKKHYKAFDTWLIGYRNFTSDFPLDKLRFTYGDLDTF